MEESSLGSIGSTGQVDRAYAGEVINTREPGGFVRRKDPGLVGIEKQGSLKARKQWINELVFEKFGSWSTLYEVGSGLGVIADGRCSSGVSGRSAGVDMLAESRRGECDFS